jgi:hypothetical protein
MAQEHNEQAETDAPVIWEELPLTPLFMMMFGIFSLLYGILLFPIMAGALPYDSEGASALFVIIFALMMSFLGFTPIGVMRHSWLLFFIGLALTMLGALAFMSPGTLAGAIGVILGLILLIMGGVRLPSFLMKKTRGASPLPLSYTILFSFMHVICIILGVLVLAPDLAPRYANAIFLIILGITQLTLTVLSFRIEQVAPGSIPSTIKSKMEREGHALLGTVNIPLKHMIMLLLATVMLMMVVISFLGAMQLIPFDSERGSVLFIFITAIQIMLVGETPVKTFAPSWPLVALGMGIAVLAMVACIIPGLLDKTFGVVMGISNLVMALCGFGHMVALARKVSSPGQKIPGLIKNVIATSCALYILLLGFATNLLAPGLIPGLLMLVILFLTGVMMIRLVFLLHKKDAMQPAGKDK